MNAARAAAARAKRRSVVVHLVKTTASNILVHTWAETWCGEKRDTPGLKAHFAPGVARCRTCLERFNEAKPEMAKSSTRIWNRILGTT